MTPTNILFTADGMLRALAAWLTQRWNWPASFPVLDAMGFIWLLSWHALYEAPEHSRRVTADMKDEP